MTNKTINFRSLISFTLLWMFLALVVSGVVLFIAPPGRIAHWTDWALLGLTKGQWQAVHTLASLVFVIVGSFHLLDLNRRAIWNYLKRSSRPRSPFRWSLALSTALAAVVLAGTAAGVPPFSLVVDLSEWSTERWDTPQRSAPVPHAEEWSFHKAVEALGIEALGARRVLEQAGVVVEGPEETLREIADRNHATPAEVYALMATLRDRGTARPAGSPPAGLGRRALADVTAEAGIALEEALARLRDEGIEAAGEDTLRDLAERNGKKPVEVWRIVSGETAVE